MIMKKKIGEYLPIKKVIQWLKKPTITETVRLSRLCWFGYVQRMEGNRIPTKVLHMNLGTRLKGRPRNRWHDEVREDGCLVWWKRVEGKGI